MTLGQCKRSGTGKNRFVDVILKDGDVWMGKSKFWPAGQFLQAIIQAKGGKDARCGVETFRPYRGMVKIHPFKLSGEDVENLINSLVLAGITSQDPKWTPTPYVRSVGGAKSFNPW